MVMLYTVANKFKKLKTTFNMKKIILSAAFVALLGGLSQVKAQTTAPATDAAGTATTTTTTAPATAAAPAATASQDSTTTPVKIEELPAGVSATLKSDAVKEYTPTDAVLVKSATKEYYIINVKKGEESRFVKLDKDGRPVK
jgi:glucose/arabinose dehydrogenase